MSEETKQSVYHSPTYETAGAALMTFEPLNSIHQSLRISRLRVCLILFSFAATQGPCGYDRTRHVHAHHYCTHLSPDFHQCVIYDSDDPDVKLIGIEYIVSEKVCLNLVVSRELSQSYIQVFETFPNEEKKFWHSHK